MIIIPFYLGTLNPLHIFSYHCETTEKCVQSDTSNSSPSPDMITSASHCDRSAFFTSSRAWFWCSDGKKHETRETNKRHRTSNVEKKGSKQNIRARAEKEARCLSGQPSGQDQGRLGRKEIQFPHITLAHPEATQQLRGSLVVPQATVADKYLRVCVFPHCTHVSVH